MLVINYQITIIVSYIMHHITAICGMYPSMKYLVVVDLHYNSMLFVDFSSDVYHAKTCHQKLKLTSLFLYHWLFSELLPMNLLISRPLNQFMQLKTFCCCLLTVVFAYWPLQRILQRLAQVTMHR